MKIGIIVHSHTGNTLSVAERIKEQLTAGGHNVTLEKIVPVKDDEPLCTNVKFDNQPAVEGYDAILFGGPVRGMSITPVMKAYLERLPVLLGKRVICFVTQYFPWKWLGGNRTLRQMTAICKEKGSEIIAIGGINWSRKSREQDIITLVNRFCQLF